MSDSGKEPIQFIRKGGDPEKVEFVSCPDCGKLYSASIFSGNYKLSLEAALSAAKSCYSCQREQNGKNDFDREEWKRKKIASATKVTDLQECFSDECETFYYCVEDAQEAGETGVFGATYKSYSINIENVIESMLEEHHEDASEDELQGLDELIAAVDIFNKKQKQGTYEVNEDVWQEIRHNQTFAMIKPDATKRGIDNDIMEYIRQNGFSIKESNKRFLTREEAEWLYREHKAKSHFKDLVDYTISGEVVLMIVEGDHANVPAKFRELMGATNHLEAAPGTIRAKFAIGYRENSIHGSDSPHSAIDEIIYFMT